MADRRTDAFRHPAARPGTKNRGFTFLELMTVFSILLILLGIGIVAVQKVLDQKAVEYTKNVLALTMEAVDAYREDKGVYPSRHDNNWRPVVEWKNDGLNGTDGNDVLLAALRHSSDAEKVLMQFPTDRFVEIKMNNGGWKDCTAIVDGFENPIFYCFNGGLGKSPAIVSCGPDGKLGADFFNGDYGSSYANGYTDGTMDDNITSDQVR